MPVPAVICTRLWWCCVCARARAYSMECGYPLPLAGSNKNPGLDQGSDHHLSKRVQPKGRGPKISGHSRKTHRGGCVSHCPLCPSLCTVLLHTCSAAVGICASVWLCVSAWQYVRELVCGSLCLCTSVCACVRRGQRGFWGEGLSPPCGLIWEG